MKITKISYKRSATLNVGDFESVRIEVGAEADVGNAEDFEDAMDELRDVVGKELADEARDVRRLVKRRDA